MEERELIQRVLQGDPEAERVFYDAHVDRVFGMAFRMTGEHSLAEDFTQDAFVRAFDRLPSFRGDSKLSTWLYSITMSVVLNGLRKRKRFQEREMGVEDPDLYERPTAETDPDLGRRIRRSVDALSEGLRAVFVLHDVEGFKHHEIAEVLDVPVGTSKARLSRARSQLREMLGGSSGALAGGESS